VLAEVVREEIVYRDSACLVVADVVPAAVVAVDGLAAAAVLLGRLHRPSFPQAELNSPAELEAIQVGPACPATTAPQVSLV
jgi:hypothetical protein